MARPNLETLNFAAMLVPIADRKRLCECGAEVPATVGPAPSYAPHADWHCDACRPAYVAKKREEATGRRRATQEGDWSKECPPRYRWASFDAPEMATRCRDEDARARARDATASTVTLIGGAGSGKTSLAAAMSRARYVTGEGNSGRDGFVWMPAADLPAARRAQKLGDGEAREVIRAMNADILVLDDLGAEDASPFARVIAEVIHHRHDHEVATIVTLGFKPEQVADRYGDGVARRLFEECAIRVKGGGRK